MKMTLLLALRNLFRQKRRNALLALVMAFSMAVLIMAGSLGAGMTDTILNKIVVRLVGHIQVDVTEKVKIKKNIIRDRKRIERIVRDNVDGIASVQERVMVYGRGIGNRRGSDIFIEGIELSPEFLQTLHLGNGDPADFISDTNGNAIIISKAYVKKLNVALNDTVRAQLMTVNGQVQTADLHIAGILKEEGSSVFQDDAIFMKVADLKKLLGYGEHESRLLLIALKDPSKVREARKKLSDALEPRPAVIGGTFTGTGTAAHGTLLSFFTNSVSLAVLTNELRFVSGNLPGMAVSDERSSYGIILSKPLADRLDARVGAAVRFGYANRFGGGVTVYAYRVTGIFQTNRSTGRDTAFISENALYRSYFESLPAEDPKAFMPAEGNLIYPALTTEWQYFPGYRDDTEKDVIMNDLNTSSWKGSLLRISTMYEEGSHLLQYAALMRMVTIVGILVLFLVSQIGVVNTMRMSIRERTREIGTMRSIGFQRTQVRDLFIAETVFLAFFAAVAGIFLAYLFMGLLSTVPIKTNNEVMNVFLLNDRLYFLADISAAFLYLAALLAISAITAFFPARRAAMMTAAEALRQRE